MTEQLYAVLDEDDKIEAVFSTENLAQLHAAKLRELLTDGRKLETSPYRVDALPVDVKANLEIQYMAYADLRLADLSATLNEIGILKVGLQVELEADKATAFDIGKYPDQSYISFTAYGWSPEQATSKLQTLVSKTAQERAS